MKLFQIEEPDGSSVNPDAPGAAVGIDATGARAEVAIAAGGNAAVLSDREGFELDLTVPSRSAGMLEWQSLLEGVRLRAERALARPVTHAVVVVGEAAAERVQSAATPAELVLLRMIAPDQIEGGESRVLAAAILAEDLAPRITAPE
ncbi:MAG: hypothetical protein JO162_03790 [Alphaproteobacteria bacterium]|nr:hypothetical protein [Alphaproteobacteria bacterium]MBV9152967.1 hypothetical protein [Alphaproteobacteria bacterium]